MLNDCRRGDAQTSVQNAQRHPAMAAICHCICILQLAFNDYRMESKILRRVRYVMNILPSFSPYPSSSLPLTKTGKKGTARDNEQKKSKIMVAEPKASREAVATGVCVSLCIEPQGDAASCRVTTQGDATRAPYLHSYLKNQELVSARLVSEIIDDPPYTDGKLMYSVRKE